MLKTLMLAGLLLLPACGTTKIVEVPVMPEPCGIPELPALHKDASPRTERGILLTAVWIHNMADWIEAVRACPFIREGSPDLRDSLAADPHLKTR